MKVLFVLLFVSVCLCMSDDAVEKIKNRDVRPRAKPTCCIYGNFVNDDLLCQIEQSRSCPDVPSWVLISYYKPISESDCSLYCERQNAAEFTCCVYGNFANDDFLCRNGTTESGSCPNVPSWIVVSKYKADSQSECSFMCDIDYSQAKFTCCVYGNFANDDFLCQSEPLDEPCPNVPSWIVVSRYKGNSESECNLLCETDSDSDSG